MRSHHVSLPRKKSVRPLDSQLRQGVAGCALLSQARPMNDQIIELGQKTQQKRPEPGSRGSCVNRVSHCGPAIPELGESFDDIKCGEIEQSFDLQMA
jgi:hypothetical protein